MDERAQFQQQEAALHDMIDAMTVHGAHVTEHLQRKDELYALLEEEGRVSILR